MDGARAAEAGPDRVPGLEQLQPIIDSKGFDAPEHDRRFLRYVVEERLAGPGERMKAYNVATSVFDRDERFDPQSDPVVRVEASRLRRSHDRHDLTAGRDDVIRMTIPKGSYAGHRRSIFATPTAIGSEAGAGRQSAAARQQATFF